MAVDLNLPQAWPPESQPEEAPHLAPSPPAPEATPAPAMVPAPATLPAPATAPATAPAPAPAAVAAALEAAPAWSLAQRLAFRFAFCYLILYLFPFPLEEFPIPGLAALFAGIAKLQDVLVLWAGKHVLHLREVLVLRGKTGSGDTTYEYVQLVCFLGLAAIATLAWTLAARRAREHRRLYEWLRIYVRFGLGTILLGYGMNKVIKLQFSFPSPDRLMEPIGESSPMGLLWTFMGVSTPYTMFAGAMEVIGGVLLFFRRTTTLGALVVIAVMTNVVMLNLCYDVPVKQFSMHLLAMAGFLLLPDLRRLADVLVLHRPTVPASLAPPYSARWARIGGLACKTLFVGWVLFATTRQCLEMQKQYGDAAPKPPLHGIYEVEEFVRNGRVVPPLLTESGRWRRLTSRYTQFLTVRSMDDTPHGYRVEYTPAKRTVTLFTGEPKQRQGSFTYSWPDKDHLLLQGTLLKDTLVLKLRRIDETKLRLVSRGFHWVSEFPFNR